MTTPQGLICRARMGDQNAFEALARAHADMMYRIAYRLVGNLEDAQDVVQRAQLSAWEGLPRFRGDAALSTWLHQIVRRHALNSLNRSGRGELRAIDLEHPDPRGGPDAVAISNFETASVHAAIASLPEPQRHAIRLHHFDGLSYAEVARATASTVPAVRSHIFRGRRTLRNLLTSTLDVGVAA